MGPQVGNPTRVVKYNCIFFLWHYLRTGKMEGLTSFESILASSRAFRMRLTIHLSASSGDMLSLSASMLIKRQDTQDSSSAQGKKKKKVGALEGGDLCSGLHSMTCMHLNYLISPFVFAQIIGSKNVQWSQVQIYQFDQPKIN